MILTEKSVFPISNDRGHSWLTQSHDPSVKVSVLATCMLSFMYNSAKCYIVNLITYSTSVRIVKWMELINHEIHGVNHVKQSSTLQSTHATYSLFQSSTLIESSLVMKELLGWSLDGALDPWSCLSYRPNFLQAPSKDHPNSYFMAKLDYIRVED